MKKCLKKLLIELIGFLKIIWSRWLFGSVINRILNWKISEPMALKIFEKHFEERFVGHGTQGNPLVECHLIDLSCTHSDNLFPFKFTHIMLLNGIMIQRR